MRLHCVPVMQGSTFMPPEGRSVEPVKNRKPDLKARVLKPLTSVALAVVIMISCLHSHALSDNINYGDISGHWAEGTMMMAVADGLIEGNGSSNLYPEDSITIAQALVVLCRVLGVTPTTENLTAAPSESDWYDAYIAQAAAFNLVLNGDGLDMDAPISRQDAFYLIAEAFALVGTETDLSVTDRFPDAGRLTPANRVAVASLISAGFIGGFNGLLTPNEDITRSEFLSLIYKVIGEYVPASDVQPAYEHGVMLRGSSAQLSGVCFTNGVWFDGTATDIDLSGTEASHAVIRSLKLDSLTIGGSTEIGRLTLAAADGDISVAPTDGSSIGTLVVGSGGGSVSAEGIDAIEVTGSGRHVTVTDSADLITVSGLNNTVHVPEGSTVGRIEFLTGASGNRALIDGNVGVLKAGGFGSAADGNGYVENIILCRNDTEVSLDYGSIEEAIIIDLTGASVSISLPEYLEAGSTLNATATIVNATPGLSCTLTWYIDGVQASSADITTCGILPALVYDFEYTPDLSESAVVSVSVRHIAANNDRQEISAYGNVTLENYGRSHWFPVEPVETPRALEDLPARYEGNYTLAWALENDLSHHDKEFWINNGGYTSTTEYIVWVNLAYQRVNIFIDNDGRWELHRVFLVATGASGSGTRTGVTTISYRQRGGWTTTSYSCRPVVRFWPGSGYAFHSRLYHPGTSNLMDARIGFPISHGCVRMYDEDIWYIFDHIPDGTTVVIH